MLGLVISMYFICALYFSFRYRHSINASSIRVFCDIKKKHSAHAATADVSVKDTAKAAEFFKADGVILTGSATGEEADAQELDNVADSVEIPVLIGSGVTPDNVAKFKNASGFIVGSYFKRDGDWKNGLDAKGETEKVRGENVRFTNPEKDLPQT